LALHVARAIDLFQLASDGVDSIHQSTSVGLELGLARSPGADAALLLGERTAGAPQTGQSVLQQRQFHLGLAFRSACVLREDVQDHRGAVDRRSPEDLLQVALLGR
jgi:hypothetical protein